MKEHLINEEAFPFVCDNPECRTEYDVDGFCNVVTRNGLLHANCGDFFYQGITCPECNTTTLKRYSSDTVPVNLRYFSINAPHNCPEAIFSHDVYPSPEADNETPEAICAKCAFFGGAKNFEPGKDCLEARMSEAIRMAHWLTSEVAVISSPDEKVTKEWKARLEKHNSGSEVEVYNVLVDINKLRNTDILATAKRHSDNVQHANR